MRQLGMPLVPVAAMADYRIGDRLHGLLRGYKDAPTPEARTARTAALSFLVELWCAANLDRTRDHFAGDWDLVVTVPSTRGRSGSPVDAIVREVPDLARLHLPALVPGQARTGHLEAARCGFALDVRCAVGLRNRRVLVFDDSVTTGSRAQSAAAALRRGRADVVGILAIGRVFGTGPATGRTRTNQPHSGRCSTRP